MNLPIRWGARARWIRKLYLLAFTLRNKGRTSSMARQLSQRCGDRFRDFAGWGTLRRMARSCGCWSERIVPFWWSGPACRGLRGESTNETLKRDPGCLKSCWEHALPTIRSSRHVQCWSHCHSPNTFPSSPQYHPPPANWYLCAVHWFLPTTTNLTAHIRLHPAGTTAIDQQAWVLSRQDEGACIRASFTDTVAGIDVAPATFFLGACHDGM